MAGTIWSKFFWSDWDTDPALKLCSYAAQGLWMRCLCIAAAHDPIGYVSVEGRPLDSTDIAKMTGGTEPEVKVLLSELQRNGVFSRDAKHRIYSRRMIRDAKRVATAKKNGKKGGNPTLRKQKENSGSDKGQDKGGVKGRVKTQEPESISQSPDNGSYEPSSTRAELDPIVLAEHFARIAGIRHLEPNRIIQNVGYVREWIDIGVAVADVESTILTQRDRSSAPIHSLRYFDAAIRRCQAQKEHPSGTRPDETIDDIADPFLRDYLRNRAQMGG